MSMIWVGLLALILLASPVVADDWYDATRDYRRNISCTDVRDGIPQILNHSGGFKQNGSVQLMFSYCDGSNMAVYYNDATDIIVANATHLIPFEVEIGNSSSYLPTQVWDDNYIIVQHMNEVSGSLIDSTKYGSNTTGSTGDPTYQQTCMVGNCIEFDGNDGFQITDRDILDITTGLTLEVWFTVNTDDVYKTSFMKGSQYQLMIANDEKLRAWTWDGDLDLALEPSASAVPGGTSFDFHSAIFNTSDGILRLYHNTTQRATVVAGDPSPQATIFTIAVGTAFNAEFFNGALDEIRASKIGRDPIYINETYFNMVGVAGYANLLAEETRPPVAVTMNISLVSPTPIDNTTHGFDYNVVINATFTNSTAPDKLFLVFGDTILYGSDLGGYAEFNPNVSGGNTYSYYAGINVSIGVSNVSDTRTLLITSLTEDEVNKLSNTFKVGDLVIVLLFVLVGIILYVLIR